MSLHSLKDVCILHKSLAEEFACLRSYKRDIFGAFSTDEILALMRFAKKSVDFS